MTERIPVVLGLALCLVAGAADALPLYAARAGRTCDNCHSLPNAWYDPPEIARRKCTLSCVGCHVDPSGGGLRTVSGRYYGRSTLPLFAARDRPLADRPHAPGSQPTSQPASQPTSGPVKPVADRPVDPRGPDAPPADGGWLAFGRPALHGTSERAWLDGRYGEENADPLLLLGADARFAFWSGGGLFFPMQADLHAMVHPVEHLRLAAVGGARGRSRSASFEASRFDDQPRFGIRDLWIMTDEHPYLAYARVGRFLPAFGTRVADHTAYIRRAFGLSQEDPANRVLGVEVGLAPNYPYGAASVFKTSTADAQNPVEPGDGWGAALSGGWRDLGWQAGASARVRRQPLAEGGDTDDLSIQWAFNPWYFWERVPLTYLGELTAGRFQRPYSGTDSYQTAAWHQLAWTAFPGIVLRGRYDFWDPDVDLKDDSIHRPGVGLDVTVVTGLTMSFDGRVGVPEGGSSSGDLFLQLHGWL